MLSYSTGESGSGAEVERVREATELVRARAPELSVEGPIQYDAAVDAGVGAHQAAGQRGRGPRDGVHLPRPQHGQQHLQGRAALGAARSPIGPVLQGLNKPVNDLSRGATVHDIVNTVAITAIQAAACERPRRQLRLLVAEVVGGRRRSGLDVGTGPSSRSPTTPRRSTRCCEVAPLDDLEVVAHRVVHGGERFSAPVLIDDAVVAAIRELAVLAPLHNPANAAGIEVARRALAGRPARRGLRHRVPRDAAAARVHLRRPARVGRAPLRLPRHLARVRLPRGRAPARPAPDVDVIVAAPRQRRVRERGGRRAARSTPRWG